jgi:hypothetical protein
MPAAKVILVQPDPFSSTAKDIASYIPNRGGAVSTKTTRSDDRYHLAQTQEVSRPLMGFQAKPNTFAFVQVIDSENNVIQVFNRLTTNLVTSQGQSKAKGGTPTAPTTPAAEARTAGSPQSYVWTDWILQAVREERMEKTQIVETFGETYLYAFGEKPRSLVITGLLMNTVDYNWKTVFWENWDRFFRASKLTAIDARVYIGWDDIIVEGYPINAVVNHTADSPNAMSFSFNFLVTNYVNIAANAGLPNALSQTIVKATDGYDGSIATLKPTRTSLVKFLGVDGANAAGRAVYDKLKASGASERAAALKGQTIAELASLTAASINQHLMGEANASSFAAALAVQASQTFMQQSRLAISDFEDEHGFVHGEVNGWFGFMGGLMAKSLPVEEIGIPQKNASKFFDQSIDSVIQDMGYQIQSAGAPGATKSTVSNGGKVTPHAQPKPGSISVVKPA